MRALRVAAAQVHFVGSVAGALEDATEYAHANPPDPPEIIGPWFLWKLLIDRRHQGRGYGLRLWGVARPMKGSGTVG